MDVKALCLYLYVTLALGLIQGPSACADSYSFTIPAGLSLIGNHLSRGSNTVAEVLGEVPDGTIFTKWNNLTRSTEPTNIFRALEGGWSLPRQTLRPGEGAWIKNPGPPFAVTMEGVPAEPVLPVELSEELVLVCRQKAASASFEQITGRRPTDDTVVYRYYDATGWLYYRFVPGVGWDPYPPKIPVGEAVFVYCKTCESIAPRRPELLTILPTDQSTNARDTKLLMHFRDPDRQIIAGSVTARLDEVPSAPPSITVPAPDEGAYAWEPPSLLSTGMHQVRLTFQIASFKEYDFNIPITTFTTNLTFCVKIRTPTLAEVLPAPGTTNPAHGKFTFTWEDPDEQLDINSMLVRLDGVLATNASFQRTTGLVRGMHQAGSPLPGGSHTLELTYSDLSIPPVSYTNQVVFYTRPAPQMQVTGSGENFVITWDGEGRLQASEDLVIWADVVSATNPFLTGPIGPRKFFRVIEE